MTHTERAVAVTTRAMSTMRSPRDALGWMLEPCGALNGRAPIDVVVESDEGMLLALQVLGRIDHGIYT
jgi:uncharacterized protein (DUF2384 family)